MNKIITISILCLLLFSFSLSAQNKKQPLVPYITSLNNPIEGCSIFQPNSGQFDCAASYVFAAPINNSFYSFPANANLGCLNTAPNQTWFLVTITSLSSSNITFEQSNSSNFDVDAAIYGPLLNNNVNNACTATLSPPVACDYDATPNTTLTLTNVSVGQKFVMVVTNYSNSNTNVSISQPSGGTVEFCKSNFTTPSPCLGTTAILSGGSVITVGQSANLSLSYSGNPPLSYNIAGLGAGIANTNPFNITVNTTSSKLYTLSSASNDCGALNVSGKALVTVQSPIVTKKLVSCIPFSGNFNDAKNLNTVTNSGVTLAPDRFGTPNEAGFFNGSSFLSLSSTDILNQEYTYSAWINPTVLPSNGQIKTILSIGGAGGDQILSISYNYSDNTTKPVWGLGSFISSGSAIPATYVNDDVIANKWYFVTAKRTFDSVEIYIDGASKIKRYTGGNNPYYGGSNVVLGARYSGSQNFTGIIDDFKIFRGALSPNEIKILYFNKTCDFEYQENRKLELMSCYPFSGNFNDNKNSQDGINTNAVLTNDRFGNTNSAFNFNGTAEMSIPSSHLLTNTFTYSTWFKASTSSAVNTILSVGNNTSSQFLGIVNNASTGNVPSLQFISSLNASTSISLLANNFTLNTWNHVVAVREPQRIKLYLNGVFIGERSTLNVASAYYGTNPILTKIGSNTSNQRFIGDLDDIKIYNGALFDAEVKALYQETSTNCEYNACPPILLINSALSGIETKKASSFMEGKSSINSPSNINFFAGKSITLTPGFNTAISTVFKAEISGCFVPTATPPVINNILTLQPGPSEGNDGEINSIYPNNVPFNGQGRGLQPAIWTIGGEENIKRAYIKFDLSQIPSNAVIDSSFLYLYFSQDLVNTYPLGTIAGHNGLNALEISRVTSIWDENTLNWNTKPSFTNINAVVLDVATSIIQNYPKIDVKNLVRDQLLNINFGFQIKNISEVLYKVTYLTSSEELNPAIRPKLVIYYH